MDPRSERGPREQPTRGPRNPNHSGETTSSTQHNPPGYTRVLAAADYLDRLDRRDALRAEALARAMSEAFGDGIEPDHVFQLTAATIIWRGLDRLAETLGEVIPE